MAAAATAPKKRMYIDGKWCEADSRRTIGVINPATEEVIEDIAYGGRAETRRALEAAHRAMPGWMKLSSWERARVLKKTAELMRERLDNIARLTQQWDPIVPCWVNSNPETGLADDRQVRMPNSPHCARVSTPPSRERDEPS